MDVGSGFISIRIERDDSSDRDVLMCSPGCTIHSPTFSGVRVAGDMAGYAGKLYEVPGPLVIIECENEYAGITWEPWNPRIGYTKPDIHVRNGSWRVVFPAGAKARVYPVSNTIDEAVSYYRDERRMASPPGMNVLKRIKRSVFLDLWLPDGRIAHDYTDACRLLLELDSIGLAEGTLLYICGWHAPYDTRMPAWEPADALGGRERFRELIRLSKSVEAIVMPHMNFWGYDRESGLLEDWKDLWTGYRWAGNVGICPGYPIEYMQIDDPRWIRLFDGYFDATVGDFELEAVFLDQCGNAYENPKGDLVKATHEMLERIHRKFPQLLLGAEVLSEHIVDHVPLIQATWLMEDNIGRFSPVTRLMFDQRVRFIPHLFLGAAVPCRYVYTNMPLIVEHGCRKVFEWYRENNRRLGGIPSVRLDYRRSGIDPAGREVLEQST